MGQPLIFMILITCTTNRLKFFCLQQTDLRRNSLHSLKKYTLNKYKNKKKHKRICFNNKFYNLLFQSNTIP